MTYTLFRIAMMICGFLGICNMISYNDYEHIIFPLMICFWGIYSFVIEHYAFYQRTNYYDSFSENVISPKRTTYNYVPESEKKIYNDCFKRCKQKIKIHINEDNSTNTSASN